MHYHNEHNKFKAQWLRNVIHAGLLPPGEVDDRSIVDVQPSDLAGYKQCHFFAGIGIWSLALKLAGWPVDREAWTASCPCQPYSVIGEQLGQEDERHLWPECNRLIAACWPAAFFGEQVASAIGFAWLDGVLADLGRQGYAARAVVLPACSVDAPHRRERVWIAADGYGLVGDAEREGLEGHAGHGDDAGSGTLAHRPASASSVRDSAWASSVWADCHDGQRRRIEPSISLLADGGAARVAPLHAIGDAIVPQVAAEVIRAFMECTPV
jgi:DNA (cytosine-5)-methyltransferase 1